MMPLRWLRESGLSVALVVMSVSGLLTGGAVAEEPALEEDVYRPCTWLDDGKDGSCGHAEAAKAYAELYGTLPPLRPASAAATGDTDVTHCLLDIEVLTSTSPKSIAGSNTLDVTSLIDGLTQFTLDLRSNMAVDAVTVNGSSASYTRKENQIVISLGSTYNTGQSFQVKVTYHGSPSSRTFFSSFSFFNTHNGSTIASTLSQPFQAHYWWPCKENWEYIDDKFTMDMWVTVPNSMVVASNGLLQGTDALSGSRLRYRWNESYPIATYLVSFAATNYTKQTYYYNHPGGSMPIEFYIYPEAVSESQPYLADIVQAVATYSDVYGQYPFINEKYGIAQFAWCCGMEHQTMTSQGAYTNERRNVHELAHSWWGDYVTCKTWHDVWLNEGCATFSEAVWQEKRPGGSYQAYIDQMLSRKPSLFADTVYCYDISDINRIFNTNYTYNKAGWVVHMLRFVLGDAAFYAGLRDYRDAYGGAAADTSDFQAVMEAASGQDLTWFFDQWVYGRGGPYYKYGWRQDDINGQHYLRYYINQYQRETLPTYPYFKMPLEIAVTTESGTQSHTLWHEHEKQWYLVPVDGTVTSVVFDPEIHVLWANNKSITYVNGPPQLMAISPFPDAALPGSEVVSAVQLQFSEPVTYSGTDFSVVGSLTGAASFTPVYDSATYTVSLQFDTPLIGGQVWTVTVFDTLLSQAGGLGLDGELAGPLPSGNGVPGGNAVFSFTLGQPLPPCPRPLADADSDGDVDLDDFASFQNCLTGSGAIGDPSIPAICGCFDHDGDGDIDARDLNLFRGCLSGADVHADPACADQWVLFQDDFDGGTSESRWRVFGSSADYTADFVFDYGSRGIPSAPNSVGGSTVGLRFTVNNNDAVAETAAVSAFPIDHVFSGRYRLSFDMWMNYAGEGQGSGTTEMMNVGIGTAESAVIWPSNTGTGYFAAVTGDGDGMPGSTADYVFYKGPTALTAASGAYAAGTHTTAQDHADSYYQNLFPSPDFPVAGAPGKQWVHVELKQVNGVVTWKMNGSEIAQLADIMYPTGNIMLGYMDLWSSIADPADETYIIYDNVVVTGLAP